MMRNLYWHNFVLGACVAAVLEGITLAQEFLGVMTLSIGGKDGS